MNLGSAAGADAVPDIHARFGVEGHEPRHGSIRSALSKPDDDHRVEKGPTA
jgi:hypothetical protein